MYYLQYNISNLLYNLNSGPTTFIVRIQVLFMPPQLMLQLRHYYTTNATLVCVLSFISSAAILCMYVFGVHRSP